MFVAALLTVTKCGNSPNVHQQVNEFTYTHIHTHTCDGILFIHKKE